LPSWHERLHEKETRQERNKRRNIIIVVASVVFLILGFFIGEKYWHDKGRQDGYAACRSNLETAIDKYPTGLHKKVMDDFKRVEDENMELLYDIRHPESK